MRVAILQFPGSNCDWDAWHAVHEVIGLSAERVWHKGDLPPEVEAVIVPGGFSFGDYLRCGAIARFSPIMEDLKLVHTLYRQGRLAYLDGPVEASPRRWESGGVLRTWASWLVIQALYFARVSPDKLALLYRHIR